MNTVLLALLFPVAAHAGIFSPSNYEDCVLDGMKEAKTDAAVAVVQAACARKFPVKDAVKPQGQNNKYNTGTECFVYWKDGVAKLGDPEGFFKFTIDYKKYMTVHFAIPHDVERKLKINEIIGSESWKSQNSAAANFIRTELINPSSSLCGLK